MKHNFKITSLANKKDVLKTVWLLYYQNVKTRDRIHKKKKKNPNLTVLNKVFKTSKGEQMFMQLDVWLKPEPVTTSPGLL